MTFRAIAPDLAPAGSEDLPPNRCQRFSRHWYDVASLDRSGFVVSAIADRELADQVARHKSMFFREKDGQGATIDYHDAVRGGLCLVPDGAAEQLLVDNYPETGGEQLESFNESVLTSAALKL